MNKLELLDKFNDYKIKLKKVVADEADMVLLVDCVSFKYQSVIYSPFELVDTDNAPLQVYLRLSVVEGSYDIRQIQPQQLESISVRVYNLIHLLQDVINQLNNAYYDYQDEMNKTIYDKC